MMIFFYSIIALVFAFFLPGHLAVRYFFPEIKFFRGPLVVSISLIAAHFTTVFLVLIGAYTSSSMYWIAGILLAASLWKPTNHFPNKSEMTTFHRIATAFETATDSYNQLLVYKTAKLIVLLAVIIVFTMFGLALAGTVGIFEDWDAIASWSSWARKWANNDFPTNFYHYSQLLPTTLSIPMVFTGIERLEFPSQAVDGVFLAIIFWTMLEYNLRSRTAAAFFSTVVMFILFYNWHSKPFLTNADIPTAFFVLLSVLLLLEGIGLNSPPKVGKRSAIKEVAGLRVDYLIASIIAAIGAALTKQSGMYVLVLWPILGFTLAKVRGVFLTKKQVLSFLGLWVLALVVGTFWFYVGELFIIQGTNGSEITYVTQTVHYGKDYGTRIVSALQDLAHRSFGWAVYPVLLSSAFFIVARKLWPVFIFTLGYLVLWGMFFSYDGRNAVPILPLVAILAGWGIAGLLVYLDRLGDITNRILERILPKILHGKVLLQSFVAIIFIAVVPVTVTFIPQFKEASDQLDYRLFLVRMATTSTRLGHSSLNSAVLKLVNENRSTPMKISTEERWVCPAIRVETRVNCSRLYNVTAETVDAIPNNSLSILVLRSGTEEKLRQVLLDNKYEVEYIIPITPRLEYAVLVRSQQIDSESNE